MERVLKFLSECNTFYIATIEGQQPRVRPFGAVCEYQGKIYFITNNKKNVYQQLQQNPRTEISGTIGGDWIRFHGKAVFDENRGIKEKMLDTYPALKNMYSIDDGIMAMFYLEDGIADFYSFKGDKERVVL